MTTLPNLRKAICSKPRHCWLRLRPHAWVEYILEYRDQQGNYTNQREYHRVCVHCRLTQMMGEVMR